MTRLATSAPLAVLVFALGARTSTAQDPLRTESEQYRLVFENERIRILEARDKPGQKSAMHSHPASAVYVFAPFKRRFTFPDGKTAEVETKAGDVIWHEALRHAGENVGTTDTHVLIFELKEGPSQPYQSDPKRASGAAAPSTHSLTRRFQDLRWTKMFPEFGDASPEIEILRVDPATQATQLLIRTPKKFEVPRHWHTGNETHTVLAGTWAFECEGKREELGPGSFNYIPSKMVHRGWAPEGGLILITVDTAWDINWVDGPPRAPKP